LIAQKNKSEIKKNERIERCGLEQGHFVTDRRDKTQDELNDDSDGKIIFGCIEINLNGLIAKS